ncbi:hypothetical protein NL378_30180, partial [Klebsiella pneumoniae]|nr:hypothetical protein [Klebsiella pneumoniae]
MRQVGIPATLAAMPSRAVKVYAALAAQRWPEGLTVNQVGAIAGMNWRTVNSALEELRAAGYLDEGNQPVGG